MRSGLYRQLRLVCVVVLLFAGYHTVHEQVVGALPEQCEDVCTGVDCGESCGVGYTMMTCADALTNYQIGWCDWQSWDSCNWICSPTSNCSTGCSQMGNWTNCGTYGLCVGPANGLCEPTQGETCMNSYDCLCNPPNPSMDNAIQSATGGSSTPQDGCVAAHIAFTYSYAGASDCSGPLPNRWNEFPCAYKYDAMNSLGGLLNTLGAWYGSTGSPLAWDMYSSVEGLYYTIESEPCWPFP